MICKKCGATIKDDSAFCGICGTRNESEAAPAPTAPAYVAPDKNEVPQAPMYNAAPQSPYGMPPQGGMYSQPPVFTSVAANKPGSYFEGSYGAYIGITLLCSLLTTLSLGFAGPALWCFKLRWIYRNTVVNGRRLKFTGGAGQLFAKCLLWGLLIIVTLSVFGLFVPVKYKRWEISHVEFDENA